MRETRIVETLRNKRHIYTPQRKICAIWMSYESDRHTVDFGSYAECAQFLENAESPTRVTYHYPPYVGEP